MIFNLPKLIGHRGVKNLAPENTLCSINQAIKFGLKWIEIDVKISKDKIPFLLHDDTLDRTTSGEGSPLNYIYKEIFNLDAGSWFDSDYKNLYPPTLKEVLNYCSKKNIGVNIELKPNKGFEKENVEAITKLIKSFKFSCQFFLSSFDLFSAIHVKELLPNSHVGILIDTLKNKNEIITILDQCKNYSFFSCGFNIKILSNEIINLFKNCGIQITVYSSKNIERNEAQKLWDLGISSVFIDDPTNYKKNL